MFWLCRLLLKITVLLAVYSAVLAVCLVPYLWLVPVAIIIRTVCHRPFASSAYGTARWAAPEDIPDLLADEDTEGAGLTVGFLEGTPRPTAGVKALFDSRVLARRACKRFFQSFQKKPTKHLVRLTSAVHTAVFAPTGVGKGVSCVVPQLLSCPDSSVVLDIKGENYRLTADARRRMGHRVIALDLFHLVTATSDTFNPLEFLNPDSDTALDDCRDLAEALVVRSGEEKDPHWNDAAEAFIGATLAMVVAFAEGRDKSLQSVGALLANPDKLQAAIKIMCESKDVWGGMLSQLGDQLRHFRDKELSSVLTTANRHLRFLNTVAVAESTRQSSFNPADLLTGKMTVYLILPPEHMRAQSALLRLWIGSLLRAVVKGGLQEKTKVQFICDEAASLGHLEALDDAVDKFRGYGVRLQLYYQSIGQLKKCWPDGQDQTLLSNVTQVFFGVNDNQTAEYVSNRLGEETIVVNSGGTSTGGSSQQSQQPAGASTGRSWNRSDNWQQLGRKLLKPEEVAALDPRIAITFTPGALPIWTRLVRYYETEFRTSHRTGWVKVLLQTCFLFLTAILLAVAVTGAFLNSFKG